MPKFLRFVCIAILFFTSVNAVVPATVSLFAGVAVPMPTLPVKSYIWLSENGVFRTKA